MVELLEMIKVQEQYMNDARGVPTEPMNTMTSVRANKVEHGRVKLDLVSNVRKEVEG